MHSVGHSFPTQLLVSNYQNQLYYFGSKESITPTTLLLLGIVLCIVTAVSQPCGMPTIIHWFIYASALKLMFHPSPVSQLLSRLAVSKFSKGCLDLVSISKSRSFL